LASTKYRHNLIGSSSGESLDPALFLLPGKQISNAPKHVLTGSVTFTPRITDRLSALFYIDGRWTSKFNTGSDLFPEKEQKSFFLANARVGIRGPEERWALEVWAQNLFDKNYQQVAFNMPFQSSGPNNGTVAQVIRFGSPSSAIANQLYGSFLAEPRTWGVTLRGRLGFHRPAPPPYVAPPAPPPPVVEQPAPPPPPPPPPPPSPPPVERGERG
jgi:outer membrane receptor protein involved in Fe transport